MNRLIRRWEKIRGKKVYYIHDIFYGISICNFLSKRKAEAALKEEIKEVKKYRENVRKMLTNRKE